MGFAKRPADFENTQLKRSYILSSNTGPDSTHLKNMDTQSCIYSLSLYRVHLLWLDHELWVCALRGHAHEGVGGLIRQF